MHSTQLQFASRISDRRTRIDSARTPGRRSRSEDSSVQLWLVADYCDAQLIELIFVDGRRRIGHQVLGGGGFGEGDDFANGFLSGEEHDHAVNAERDAAVRWRAIGQRVEEETEAAAQLFLAQAESFEKAFLNVLAVDS